MAYTQIRRLHNDELYTQLNDQILHDIGFKDLGKCEFKGFENMNYWVQDGICLFYNTPISQDHQASYYVGFAEMRQGIYVAVAFRWIDSLEELMKIQESIRPTKIK